ncbi:adenylate/guanylate cyclase domain-containing protein [Nocardioides sp. TRM66260-LWL]|uniref:adenylate/guanylate cyclase domain-containing protein n=1 Tax=Nocardioides sp. TRM66260-LWL TaxID=2874478 RepID=UPI001CC60E3B|nr:adenylate/guanylate cyclase domain-containing protein [Nocardioides sp. TRM66260-LWL]MBZ5736101.1 adenylate/guanylate cyclase domain-containing protein [Nocardioides sp. TRM66260-LWL]
MTTLAATRLALAVVAVAAVALGVLVLALRRRASGLAADLAAARERIGRLEADLDTALRPATGATTAERALRTMVGTAVETAARVRRHGVTGLLAMSLDDLTAWALERRPDILEIAAPDGSVTLLFSDIEDSTALNHRLGDRTWVKVLEAHDALVRGAIERRRGQVVKTAGDGFMVAFRDPTAAVLAARSIQRSLARSLDPRLRLTPVRVRIGVHTGTVISRDGDYFGRNVALAARVASLAGGGEVLLSDAVAQAARGHRKVVVESAGDAELKGLPGRHRLWRLRWDAAARDGLPGDAAADAAQDAAGVLPGTDSRD